MRSKKAFQTFFFELVQECLPAQGEAPFFAQKFGVYKHRLEELRLVHVCANFTHPLSPLLSFFEFFSYFDHHQSTEKEQTIDIQHLLILSIVLNMSKVCHRKNTFVRKEYIFCKILVDTRHRCT